MAERSTASKVQPLRKPRPCPHCSKLSSRETYPFCSQRCADIDLGKWLGGAYALPANESDDFSQGGEEG
ncbi:MAG: DNA gyrase inhibitor YacG [Rhizobiaceae bacterium]